ncbi:MAG: DUF4249 domain-containing protein [Bacteroidales bacterium]|jgi:hypothetical protein
MKKYFNQYKITIIFSLIISLILVSCTKIIPYKGDITDKKIVANGLIIADSTISVKLTYSKNYNDNNPFVFVDDANIHLFENDKNVGSLTYQDSGIYSIDYVALENQKYKIEITHNDFEELVSSEFSIPTKIEITNFDPIVYYADDNYSDYINVDSVFYSFNIQDDKNTENFYMIKVLLQYHYVDVEVNDAGSIDTIYYNGFSNTNLRLADLSLGPAAETLEYPYSGIIFTDEIFNGESINVKFYSSGKGFNKGDINKYHVNVYSISKELFLYYSSYNAYQNSFNPIGNITSEPVFVYSNVKNGIGIIGGASMQKEILTIQ